MKFLLAFLMIVSSPLLSETPPLVETNEFQEDKDDHFTQQLLQMLASLGLILAVVLILTWFLKKMLNTRLQQMNTTSEIQIIERRALSPKSVIYLLELKGKGVVIAESTNGITHLTEYTPEEATEEKAAT